MPTSGFTDPQRHLWQELDLLCRIGIGIAPIAQDLAALLRQLIGADAVAVFWLDAQGMPEGFYHEDSPPEVQDLFLNEFERLFVGANEINVFALANHRGRRIGNLVAPGRDYFKSNTFNLLVRASGHRHTLDLRVEVDGQARAVVLLFRAPGTAYADPEAGLLQRLAPYLERALSAAQPPEVWCGRTARCGHVLLDAAGERILLVDAEAAALLKGANRRGMGLNSQARLEVPPAFLRELCQSLGRCPEASQAGFAILGGALVARAHALTPPDAAPGAQPTQVLVELRELRPTHLDVIRRIKDMKLSPLQREIAFLAGLGKARSNCTEAIGVSHEALKKHLRVIYAAAGVSDWEGLSRSLEA